MKKFSNKLLTILTLSAVLITSVSAGVCALDSVSDKSPAQLARERNLAETASKSEETDFVFDPSSDKSRAQQMREAQREKMLAEAASNVTASADAENSGSNESAATLLRKNAMLAREQNLAAGPQEVVLTEEQIARLDERGDIISKLLDAQTAPLSSELEPEYHEYELLSDDSFLIESLFFTGVSKSSGRQLASAYVNFNFHYDNGKFPPEFPINREFYCYSELLIYCGNSNTPIKQSNRSPSSYTAQQSTNQAVEYSHLYDLSGYSDISKITFNLYLIDASTSTIYYPYCGTQTLTQILAN